MIFKPKNINEILKAYADKKRLSKKELIRLLEYADNTLYNIMEKYNALLVEHNNLKKNLEYDQLRYLYKIKNTRQ